MAGARYAEGDDRMSESEATVGVGMENPITLDELWSVWPRGEVIAGGAPAARRNDEQRREVHRLRSKGLTYAEIGRRCGISRERVRQLATVNPPRQKQDIMSRPTLTPSEAARLLGVHPGTVRKWADRGLLRSFRVGPRRDRRFLRDDVVAFLTVDEEQAMRLNGGESPR